MFIWDFVADKILGQIVDWFYSQVVGFLGNFFSEMGSMGAELFEIELGAERGAVFLLFGLGPVCHGTGGGCV